MCYFEVHSVFAIPYMYSIRIMYLYMLFYAYGLRMCVAGFVFRIRIRTVSCYAYGLDVCGPGSVYTHSLFSAQRSQRPHGLRLRATEQPTSNKVFPHQYHCSSAAVYASSRATRSLSALHSA